MKKALFLLIIGLAFNSCEEKPWDGPCRQFHHKEGKECRLEKAEGTEHSLYDKSCNPIDEWLNRESMGRFLKNHISIETELNRFIG